MNKFEKLENTDEATSHKKIEPIGSYLTVDKGGFIVNPTSMDRIQERWLPVVEEIKEEYIKNFGEKLHSVYIRGSVAKGEAIENVSDVDAFAFVDHPRENIDVSGTKEFKKNLTERYPFVTGVEMGVFPLQEFDSHQGIKLMIKTQSICIYGKNLADEIEPFKPGRDTAQHIKFIEKDIGETKELLKEDCSDEDIKNECTWIMKRLLRTGFELVMERSQKYTRDLYKCYEGFSEYYPEKKDEMYRVLELAINPTADKEEITKTLDNISDWLVNEVGIVFDLK